MRSDHLASEAVLSQLILGYLRREGRSDLGVRRSHSLIKDLVRVEGSLQVLIHEVEVLLLLRHHFLLFEGGLLHLHNWLLLLLLKTERVLKKTDHFDFVVHSILLLLVVLQRVYRRHWVSLQSDKLVEPLLEVLVQSLQHLRGVWNLNVVQLLLMYFQGVDNLFELAVVEMKGIKHNVLCVLPLVQLLRLLDVLVLLQLLLQLEVGGCFGLGEGNFEVYLSFYLTWVHSNPELHFF